MFDHLIPDLLALISEYLTPRDFLCASQVNRHWRAALTSLSTLRYNCPEPNLTRAEMLRMILALSKYVFVQELCLLAKSQPPFSVMCYNKRTSIMHIQRTKLLLWHTPASYDVGSSPLLAIHQLNTEESRVLHASKVLLYHNGSIQIGEEIYHVQALYIELCCVRGVMYRQRNRRYYILYPGYEPEELNIPQAEDIKSLSISMGTNGVDMRITIKYILYTNGDLHETDLHYCFQGLLFMKSLRLSRCACIRHEIKRIIWLGERRYWVLTQDGSLSLINNDIEEYQHSTVSDMGVCRDILFFLTSAGKIYFLREPSSQPTLLYDCEEPLRHMMVWRMQDQIMFNLLR